MNEKELEIIKGYIIAALRNAEFDKDSIIKAIDSFDWASNHFTAEDALEYFKNFKK